MIEVQGKYTKDVKIFVDEIEEEALTQIYENANHPCHKDAKIRVMADTHKGSGSVIGYTQVLTDYVNPSQVGVDIGCTIDCRKTSIPVDKVTKELLQEIDMKVKTNIPFGMNVHKSCKHYDQKELYRFIQKECDKARSGWPEMVQLMDINEKSISNMLKRIGMDEGLFYQSIGTVGGGNHFIEFGNWDGFLSFSIHCGSRNFGLKVCKYWENIAKNHKIDKMAYRKIEEDIKKNTADRSQIGDLLKKAKADLQASKGPIGYLTGDEMSGYISDMVIATAYAQYNHLVIARMISHILIKMFAGFRITETVTSIHNYISFTEHIIRKGAIRSYRDELMVVPFNMRDGMAICTGKSNPDWNYSCAHGAGRKMSRSKAKANVSLEEFQKSMEGIVTSSVCESTIDESPMAYKDTETIIRLLEPTCEIITMVRPLLNIKDC